MSTGLYDYKGNLIKRSLNLEPTFFQMSPESNLSTQEIEAKPYQWHAWTHACAWVIARNLSHLPLMLVDKKTKKERVDDRWRILDLFEQPNELMTQTSFMQFVILGLILNDSVNGVAGQVFITPKSGSEEKTYKVDLHKGEIPDVMYPFTDKNFEVDTEKKANGLGVLNGWKFMINGKPLATYNTNEIIRIYLANPYDWLSGLSLYTPAKLAVLQDIKADLYNASLYDNNATPAGILTSDSVLTAEQQAQMMRSFMEEFSGAANAAKVAVLGKGLRFERIALTQQDMQFAESKANSLEQIIASFGLNKIALGMYEDLNLATIREGRRMLWQDTYLPLGNQIMEAINSQWIKHIDKDIWLKFDTSNVEALRPDYTERMEVANLMIRDGVPVELAFRINEIPLSEDDLKKYPWLEEKPEALPKGTPVTADNDNSEKSIKVKTTKETLTPEQAFSNEFIAKVLDPGEKDLQKKLDRFFISQRNRMQDKVDDWVALVDTTITPKSTKGLPEGLSAEMFLLDGVNENEALERLLAKPYKDQLKRTEASLEQELDGLIGWRVTDDTVTEYIALRREVIKGINTTTFKVAREQIGDAIEEAFISNDTIQQAAKRIKVAIGDTIEMRKNQAKTIARTEIGTVTSTSRFDAFKTEGIEYHQWVTAQDEGVRDTHVLTNGSIERVGDQFTPIGIAYPLEMGGPPEEVINCRCITIAASNPKEKDVDTCQRKC